MGLIEDGAIPWNGAAPRFPFPVEIRVDDHTFGHKRCAVALVKARVVTRIHLVAKDCWIPFELAEMPPRIRVEQQLVRVEPEIGRAHV